MSASRPVGINTTLTTGTGSTQSSAIQQQCDSLRIVAESAGVYVTYGGNPTATNEHFYVPTFDTAEISLGPVSAQKVSQLVLQLLLISHRELEAHLM
jgi:hypothetical protein